MLKLFTIHNLQDTYGEFFETSLRLPFEHPAFSCRLTINDVYFNCAWHSFALYSKMRTQTYVCNVCVSWYFSVLICMYLCVSRLSPIRCITSIVANELLRLQK